MRPSSSRPRSARPQAALRLQRLALIFILGSLCLLAVAALIGPHGRDPGGAPDGAADAVAPSAAQPSGPGPATAQGAVRSADRLLDDTEFVYGPAVEGFDSAVFLAARGGALAETMERLAGDLSSAGAIVDDVARDHSVSPRLLLALIALEGEDGPQADAGSASVADAALAFGDLAARLNGAAAWLSDGYYGLKYRRTEDVTFADGERRHGPVERGAAHFAVARYLALNSSPEAWPSRLDGFARTYSDLFGDLPAQPSAPLPASGLSQPPLLLPWPEGERWHFTGGPHGGWGVATAWAAVDFASPSVVGCAAAPEWVIAAAPGVISRSHNGLVVEDLDGDGFEGTGWVLIYLHMASDGRVPEHTVLAAGDRIGHPSCEGGRATGAHVHLARRFNGEWLPAAGGPVPLELSGWSFASGGHEYDGTMTHPQHGTRVPVTSRADGPTEVVSDNGPARRAALADGWAAVPRVASVQPALAPAPAPATAPQVAVGGSGGRLAVGLLLDGRRSHTTSFILGLARAGGDPEVVLMGRTDLTGRSEPIALPAAVTGVYTVTLRAPGFLAAQVVNVSLGAGDVALDFAMGGLTPLRSGDLTGDDAISASDLVSWVNLFLRRAAAADLDGDGHLELADARSMLANLGHSAFASGGR